MMNTKEQMERIGNELLKHYKDDLKIDLEAVEQMQDGEEGFWEVYPSGTQLLTCRNGRVSLDYQNSVVDNYTGKAMRWYHFKKDQLWEEITALTIEERKEKIIKGLDQMNKKFLEPFFTGIVNREPIRKKILTEKGEGILVVDPEGQGIIYQTQESGDRFQEKIRNAKAVFFFRGGNFYARITGQHEEILRRFKALPERQYMGW